MKIIEIDINKLIEYENNPRDNESAVPVVAESIHRFGFKVPLVIDVNNVIVTGHTRYKAAKSLGMKIVPCILADDLNEEQITAFRLVDNKTAELAGWDFVKLDNELAELGMAGVDLGDFGLFSPEERMEIDALFAETKKTEKEPKKYQCECCGEWFTLDEVE